MRFKAGDKVRVKKFKKDLLRGMAKGKWII